MLLHLSSKILNGKIFIELKFSLHKIKRHTSSNKRPTCNITRKQLDKQILHFLSSSSFQQQFFISNQSVQHIYFSKKVELYLLNEGWGQINIRDSLITLLQRFMKQNQSLYRPFPGQNAQVKHYDLLNAKSPCFCSQCKRIKQEINPQIKIDEDLNKLKSNNITAMNKCDQVIFLNQFKNNQNLLPRFRFLDTIIVENGQPIYAIYFQDGKAKIIHQLNMKAWIIERKQQLDLRYQIKKYQREHPQFHFASFQHQSEKRIKQFENNIKYKMPPILNKVAILKLKNITEQKVISKNEFQDLFSQTKQKMYDINEIQYIQVFPIMFGEQDQSYVKSIKYFRKKQFHKKSFKLAEGNIITWRQKNESLQRIQDKVFQQISSSTQQEISQDMKLQYMTYKILIYFQQISNIRIEQAIVHFITNDMGRTFYFKKIQCIKFEKKVSIDQIGVELPNKKDIAKEDHIDLRGEMKKLFEGFQNQFYRLDKQRQQMQNKVKKDKQYSNYVFKTVTHKTVDNLQKILQSNNQKYKKQQLKL